MKILLGLLFFFKLAYGQTQQIKKLDGTKISFTEIDNVVKRLMDKD